MTTPTDAMEAQMRIEEWNAKRKNVRTKHGDISYVEVGSGPAALFVHGAFLTGVLWRNVIDLVGGDRRCIAIDLPAHGHTRISPGVDLSPRGHAEILDELCAALGLDAVDLVGNDSGGAMCQLVAAYHPERLRTLTLTNCETPNALPRDNFTPPEFSVPAATGELAPRTAHLLDHPEIARAGKGIGVGYAHPEQLTDEMVSAYLSPTFSTPERGKEFERWLVGLASRDLRDAEPFLRQLDVPTLIVWATDDDLFDLSAAHWLEATIPAARPVVEIDGGRLFFPDERPEELARALRRLWREHPGGTRAASGSSDLEPSVRTT